jgi:ADP-heptose:LPS heptosyltransferase
VLVYPGGGILPIRAWPLESHQAVCAALRDDGCAIAVIGMNRDRVEADALAARLAARSASAWPGTRSSVRHLLALFRVCATADRQRRRARTVRGAHAAADDRPVRAGNPALYGSHAPNAHFMYRALPCSPCLTAYNHRNSPCDGDNQCLKQIAPADVLARARTLLALRPAPALAAAEAVAGV